EAAQSLYVLETPHVEPPAHQVSASILHSPNSHLLRLPSELLSMVFGYLVGEKKVWLSRLPTVCKSLLSEAESALYHEMCLGISPDASNNMCRITEKPSRASLVRKLVLGLYCGLPGSGDPLKAVLLLFTNLHWLRIFSTNPGMFEHLVHIPSRLRVLELTGSDYTPHIERVLAAHPDVEHLAIVFAPNRQDDHPHPISRPDILPKLKSLVLKFYPQMPPEKDLFMASVRYPYPVSHLSVTLISHDDLIYAMDLFADTLVTVNLVRKMDERCAVECFWPTHVLAEKRFPKLQHLRISDLYGHSPVHHGRMETIALSGSRDTAPVLRSVVWGADQPTMNTLRGLPDTSAEVPIENVMDRYARTLFESIPTLRRLGIYHRAERYREIEEAVGEVYMQAENGCLTGPTHEMINFEEWRGS
ncbi:hypothetical protein C8Q77DRAFT_1129400, partial [Trametes polyzona]